jgi:sacsin
MNSFLGAKAPSAAAVYRSELLPNLGTLPAAVRDEAMLLLLRSLPELQHHDRGLMALLAATPFLPNGQGQLHTPAELYDPRCPELVALLDPDACFPAPAFCGGGSSSSSGGDGVGAEPGGDEQQQQQQQQQQQGGQRRRRSSSGSGSGGGGVGSGFSSLAVLQQLGLRSVPHLGTFVEAGRYVERLAREGDEELAAARGMVRKWSARQRGLGLGSLLRANRQPWCVTAAVLRCAVLCCVYVNTQALLAFLNSEAERLVGQHTAITSAAAAVMAQAAGLSRSSSSSSLGGSSGGDVDAGSSSGKGRPGAGLFRAMKKGLWGLAGGKPQHQQQSLQQLQQQRQGGLGPTAQQDATADSSEAVISAQWAELARTCWCPMLTQPPEPVLPWQALDSSSKGKQAPRLAAPCAMRPQRDLWLVSAVAAVVDGQCSSPVMLAGLGW